MCHDMLDNDVHFPAGYVSDVRRMLDFKTPNPLMENKPFEFWWEHIHGRMCHHEVRHEQMKALCVDAAPKMKLRAGVKEALAELARHGIPVTIVSAGITPIIQEVLEYEGLDTPNVFVCANSPIFDDTHGAATHWHPLIPVHSRNKGGVHKIFGKGFMGGHGKERSNVLVLGDSIGDAAAGELCPHSTTRVRIGFYYNKGAWTKPVEEFEEAYDILLDGKDGDLAWLAEALKEH
jgi:2-hydroxy-3-keto-5-methylthiopentenyl-1-phosphate phosphatase